VVLTWGAPFDGGDPITDYTVEFKESANPTFTVFPDGVSATTGATVTGLTNGVSHDFKVRAVNAIGQGPDSNIITETPNSCPADWFDCNWEFRKAITIDSSQVIGGDQTNFAVLVSVTDTDLTAAQIDGDDILLSICYLPRAICCTCISTMVVV